MPDHSNVRLINGLWVALPVEPPKPDRPFAWMRAKPGTMLARLVERVEGSGIEPQFTPEQTRAAMDEFLELFPEGEVGPSHCVFSDDNLEADSIGSAIRGCLEYRNYCDAEEADYREVAHFLAALLALDDDERMYDDDEG
jgi:hypothetical protein